MINDLPIVVGIATIEARKESLIETLESLSGQVDGIAVYANDYDTGYLGDWKNVFVFVNNGDIGDIGKFYRFFDISPEFYPKFNYPAYLIVCDDDLIYSPDFAETAVAGIERHKRKAVVGFHGKEYYGRVQSYYRDFNEQVKHGLAANYRCLDDLTHEATCTVIGTGCTGWHSSLFDESPLTLDDFRHDGELAPNMADIWFSKKCNDLGIPRVVIPHEAGWIRHTDKVDTSKDTIAARYRNNDELQTAVFNSVEWKI